MSAISKEKWPILILSVVFSVFTIFLPDTTPPGQFDRNCFISWSNFMLGNGLNNIYKFGVDYLPLYHYLLFFYGKLVGDTAGIVHGINSLKLVTLLFELMGVYYAYLIVKPTFKVKKNALMVFLLIPFNIAFFYDNIIYGQVDGIYTTFAVMSIFYALQKRPALSLICFVVGLNFKLQTIVFFPLIAMLNFPAVFENFTIKKAVQVFLPAIFLQVLIVLPFALSGDLYKVWEVVMTASGKFERLSMGAFNFWALFFEHPFSVHDGLGIWGRSYNVIGLGLFILFSGIFLFPIFFKDFQFLYGVEPSISFSVEKAFLTAGLLVLGLFYFNTQMHSRYIHSAVLMIGIYSIYTRRYLPYILISIAYFLNIEGAAKILKGNILPFKSFLFQPWFVSILFLVLIVLLMYHLFSKHRQVVAEKQILFD